MKLLNIDLAEKAMNGDKLAQRLYCGSYDLYMTPEREFYRVKGDAPSDWSKVTKGVDKNKLIVDIYDADGFLKPDYWGYPRCIDGVLS